MSLRIQMLITVGGLRSIISLYPILGGLVSVYQLLSYVVTILTDSVLIPVKVSVIFGSLLIVLCQKVLLSCSSSALRIYDFL